MGTVTPLLVGKQPEDASKVCRCGDLESEHPCRRACGCREFRPKGAPVVRLAVLDGRLVLELLTRADQADAFGGCADHSTSEGGCSVCGVIERLQSAIWAAEERSDNETGETR